MSRPRTRARRAQYNKAFMEGVMTAIGFVIVAAILWWLFQLWLGSLDTMCQPCDEARGYACTIHECEMYIKSH